MFVVVAAQHDAVVGGGVAPFAYVCGDVGVAAGVGGGVEVAGCAVGRVEEYPDVAVACAGAGD